LVKSYLFLLLPLTYSTFLSTPQNKHKQTHKNKQKNVEAETETENEAESVDLTLDVFDNPFVPLFDEIADFFPTLPEGVFRFLHLTIMRLTQ